MVNIKFVQAKLYELWVNGTYFSAHPRIMREKKRITPFHKFSHPNMG